MYIFTVLSVICCKCSNTSGYIRYFVSVGGCMGGTKNVVADAARTAGNVMLCA